MNLVSLLALGLVAGLAAVERKGFLQAMLSRPIALGPIAGLVLGDVRGGLFVAAPLELLWLGAVNLGAALPVHESLGTAAIAGGAVLGLRELGVARASDPALLPAVAVLAVLICSPLALIGRRADRLVERWNERLYARAERELQAGHEGGAVRANLYGLAMPFGVGFVLAPLGAAAAAAVIPLVATRAPEALPALALGWIAFTGLSCASGAKAMRAPQARLFYYAAIGAGLCLLLVSALAGARP